MAARVRLDNIRMRHAPVSGVEFREIQSMTDAFSAVAATEGRAWTSQASGQPMRLAGQAVTPDFFRVFGEQPALGRFFTPEDQEFQSVVLSQALWQSQFGSDASVIGRVLMLDDKPHRIIGVAPAAFRFPAEAQAWTPILLTPGRLQQRGLNPNGHGRRGRVGRPLRPFAAPVPHLGLAPMSPRVMQSMGAASAPAPTAEFSPQNIQVTAHVNAMFALR